MIPPVAYIDPGSGSLFIQAAIAAIVAVPIFLRSQIARVFRAFRRGTDEPADRDDASAGA